MELTKVPRRTAPAGSSRWRWIALLVLLESFSVHSFVAPLEANRRLCVYSTTSPSDFTTAAMPAEDELPPPPTEETQEQKERRERRKRIQETKPSRTLYEILGASPTDTRAELKLKYVALARKTHPDALLTSGNETAVTDVEFSEVAAAWRVLSDSKERKRYDRQLKAAEFSEQIVSWASNLTQQAAPAAEMSVQVWDKVAMPFIRRTTATTLASIQALSGPKKEANGMKLSDSFREAMKAAQKAGRAVDRMEFIEKSQELEARAVTEYKTAVQLQKELQRLGEERLRLALHTRNSGLTAAEARIMFEEFNRTVADQITVWDRAMMKHTVEEEILELQRFESSFMETQLMDEAAQEDYREGVRARLLARTALLRAEKEEEEARKAYEEAQRRVIENRYALDEISKALVQAEAQAKKSSFEVERKTVLVEKQSEKVRLALSQKEKLVIRQRGIQEYEYVNDAISEVENNERLQKLEEVRNAERELSERCSQIELKAARLLSRANKLKQRAEELEGLV